jgi:ABC-type uncharacterized transport system involved in gliding motility auxiliary subunit
MGAVAILFGILSFVLQLFSGVMLPAERVWIGTNLLVGFGLLLFALFTNMEALRERMRSGEARRAGKYGTSAILGTVFTLALLGMLAFLSTRYHTRWDWTEAQSHSLSQQTLKTLQDMERDVEITAVYAAIAAEPARALLDRYSFASERVKVEYLDPQAQPGRLREMGIDAERIEGGLLHVSIGEESVDLTELTEEDLTNALVKLTRQEQKKVYLLIGHNERPFEGETAEEGSGFTFAAEALENENYQVQPLLLAATGAVPDDADVVIAAGPTRPYHESEHAALTRYLEAGGAMMVLLDPRANTDLYDDIAGWGIEVGDDVIVDRVQGMFGRPMMPFAAEYADHPITRDLQDATIFSAARSVKIGAEVDGQLVELVRTSQESWAERDWDRIDASGDAEFNPGEDVIGPVPLAVGGTLVLGEAGDDGEEAPSARIVVVGDSDFATNQFIGEFRNKDLFVNSVNWLLGDVDAISIRPGQARASRLELSADQFANIRILGLFVLPELIAALGVFAWWARRRAPGR